MTRKQIAKLALEALDKLYPEAECSLCYEKPYELLFATRLSAQCTDARVNLVTKELFSVYPTLRSFAQAREEDVEALVHSCGFYRQKAKNIVATAKLLVEDYNEVLPDTLEELCKLPGVGRKTANLILGDVFHKPSVVTDTHCIRIANRLGLCKTTDPYGVELALRELLPPERSGRFCHQTVLHGRALCMARKPRCGECLLRSFCKAGRQEGAAL